MKIKNVSSTKLIIGDMTVLGYPLELAVDQELVIFDEDAAKSAGLSALILSGAVQVIDESIEPVEIGHGEEYVEYKALMTALAAAITDLDARVTALEGHS